MRKFYPLVAGLFLCLATMKTNSQQLATTVFEFHQLQRPNAVPAEISEDAGLKTSNETKTDLDGSYVDCQANFEVNHTPNSPLLQKFTALPSNSEQKRPVYICWSFGDGKDTCIQYLATSTGPYPIVHAYQQPGEYEVCIKILYDGGCEASSCKKIIIEKPDDCKIDFERVLFTSVNHPLLVYYKALPWHNNNKKPVRLCWNFGDGKDTCITYPENYSGTYAVSHPYQQAGNYEVCVKALYQGGCETYKCKGIAILNADSCRINFEQLPLTPGSSPSVKGFKALPTLTNTRIPKQICWYFGDGKDTCVEYAQNFYGPYTIYHNYTSPGNYQVCVKVLYYGGCEAKSCKSIQVGKPDECKINFERLSPTLANNPLLAYYKAQPAHTNNKKPKQICWYFGDGRDTCITYPENYTGDYVVKHEYRESGNYEVCIKAVYYGGCEAKSCRPIQIGHPMECKAEFERIPISSINNPWHIAFRARPWHSNNKKPKLICWTFGDGKDTCIEYPETYTGSYVVGHTYRQSGRYEVCVKIFYYGGCEAKKCEFINMEGPGECRVKIADLSSSSSSLIRGIVIKPWSSLNKKPLAICVNFGDGKDTCIQSSASDTLAQELILRHTYPAPGVYRTCVKVLFEGGCYAFECTEVVIRPVTNLCGGYMTDSLVSPKTIRFNGFAITNQNDAVVEYRWNFGDGNSATGKEVTHTYPTAGTYEVCLQIKTQKGCITKICKKLVLPGEIRPVLQISPNPVISTLHLSFYSTHTESVTIKVVNANGVIVKSFTRSVIIGPNTWDLDVAVLTPGIYTLYIQSANQMTSQLFIKN